MASVEDPPTPIDVAPSPEILNDPLLTTTETQEGPSSSSRKRARTEEDSRKRAKVIDLTDSDELEFLPSGSTNNNNGNPSPPCFMRFPMSMRLQPLSFRIPPGRFGGMIWGMHRPSPPLPINLTNDEPVISVVDVDELDSEEDNIDNINNYNIIDNTDCQLVRAPSPPSPQASHFSFTSFPPLPSLFAPPHIPPTTNTTQTLTQSQPTPSEKIPSSASTIECPICLGTVKRVTATICGHIYCFDCITKSIQSSKSCPLCKKKLTLKNIHPLYF